MEKVLSWNNQGRREKLEYFLKWKFTKWPPAVRLFVSLMRDILQLCKLQSSSFNNKGEMGYYNSAMVQHVSHRWWLSTQVASHNSHSHTNFFSPLNDFKKQKFSSNLEFVAFINYPLWEDWWGLSDDGEWNARTPEWLTPMQTLTVKL